MSANRERQVGHMTGFPPAVYPFAFNSIRSHSPFDLLANSNLFGRFGADLPKEMAALCEYCTCSALVYYIVEIKLLKMFTLDYYNVFSFRVFLRALLRPSFFLFFLHFNVLSCLGNFLIMPASCYFSQQQKDRS